MLLNALFQRGSGSPEKTHLSYSFPFTRIAIVFVRACVTTAELTLPVRSPSIPVSLTG